MYVTYNMYDQTMILSSDLLSDQSDSLGVKYILNNVFRYRCFKAAKTAWKQVEGGGYPFIYNRKTGKMCLENLSYVTPSKINGRKDTFPNHRGNFGRVVTTQGKIFFTFILGTFKCLNKSVSNFT